MNKAPTKVGNKIILALGIMGKQRLLKAKACLFAKARGNAKK